jgi:putative SOS response-associated peptidase YedK
MCGRFTQNLSGAELHRLADLIGQSRNLPPRYNIAPKTTIEVIRPTEGGSDLVPMCWGLGTLLVEKDPQRASRYVQCARRTPRRRPDVAQRFQVATLHHPRERLL